jgi:predicted NACHT family NTPase
MAKRSLKASEIGIKTAKQAFRRTGWTQEYLASAVGLETRQSIWKFFSGRPIERHLFIEICFQLNLNWEEIVAPPEEEEIELPTPEQNSVLERSFQSLRARARGTIETRHSLLQVSLDTAHPLGVEQVFTGVQILPTPNSQRWLEVSHLEAEEMGRSRSNPRRPTTNLTITEILPSHNRIFILGKPGAGKTTLLQHLAIQCAQGELYPDRIPIFISLRTFAVEARAQGNLSLEQQVIDEWSAIGLPLEQIHTLLQSGQVLFLLDGLDEVPRQDSDELSYQIQKFADTYPQTIILITCRLAAQDYQFRGFTYVELADFDSNQIATVARRWFVAMNRGKEAEAIGLAKAEQFLQHLDRPENEAIREMTATPLLLHLACLVFHEQARFPKRRAKLYQAGLDILLIRWDRVRGIQRDGDSGHLPLPETLNLLSQMASVFFERGKIYFEKSEILPIISDFLLNLPSAPADPEVLWLRSEAVLRAIVFQTGLLTERARDVYSFSHLTFQEYLTARKIVARCLNEGTVPLKQLAAHTSEQRWSEVILLTLSLLAKAEPLLGYMRQEVDRLAQNDWLQEALQWVNQKAEAAPTLHKPAAVRAFYLPLCYNQDINLAVALDDAFAFDLEPPLSLDLAIARTYQKIQQFPEQPSSNQILDLWFALDFGRQFPRAIELNCALEQLKARLPGLDDDEQTWLLWWQQNKLDWLNQFQEQILKPQNMGFGWNWGLLQQQRLWEYYRVNQFLIHCLSSECSVDPTFRAHFEASLLATLSPAVTSPYATSNPFS